MFLLWCSWYANSFLDTLTSQSNQLCWYFEVHINEVPDISHSATFPTPPSSPTSTSTLRPHLRVGWADFELFSPYPASNGQLTTSGGIGDDYASVGFDGEQLWLGGQSFKPSSSNKFGRLRKQVCMHINR